MREQVVPDLSLVSVCIPAFNASNTLGTTLDSILGQDYPNCEIIVSDNHSTDLTREVILSYADRGVRYCSPPDPPDWAAKMPAYIGAYLNANFVASLGQGQFLCLYHADDLYEPSIVRQQVEVMQAHPHVGAVFTRMRMIGEDSRPIRMGTSKLPDELRRHPTFDFPTLLNAVLAHSNFLPTPSVMLRRSVIERVDGFDERQFLTSADLEMWLRIARQGYEIALIDQPLLKYRISQRQWGGQYNKLRTTLADIFGVLDYFLSQPETKQIVRPDAWAVYMMERAADQVLCAMNLLAQGNVAEARKRLTEALHWRHFVTALKRPRRLARFVVGACFWISTCLGLGTVLGQQVYRAYQRDLQRRREPVA